MLRLLGGVQAPGSRETPGPGAVPACPPGWRTGPPDFVGLAAKKAGTTWWHDLIVSHPEIHRREPAVPGSIPARVKEVHFFQVHWNNGFSEADAHRYHQYFPRPPGRRVGEWTPRYLLDYWTPSQLRIAAPDAKLLVLVRDPLERFCSSVTHYLFRHGFLEHPRAIVEEVEYGRYAAGLERLLRHFPREQVLVLQYERCVRQPEVELAATYRFLGLENTEFVPSTIERRLGAARAEKINLPDELRAELLAEYEPDVQRLATAWPEVDLGMWRNFAHLA
ncbi:MAG: sulfotransferase domain-containing protein [Acidimicrobiales bacterium]